MAATEGNGFSVRAQPARVRVAPDEYLRCPNCGSTDLKKVSLAYQEGLFYTAARTRLRAVGVGSCGPDFVIGKATTRGFHQSVLSKQLTPPVKWSYRKLILWWVSPPLVLWSGLSAVTFLLLLVFFWRHNQSTHKRRYSQWERSLLCQRCGTLTEQEF